MLFGYRRRCIFDGGAYTTSFFVLKIAEKNGRRSLDKYPVGVYYVFIL